MINLHYTFSPDITKFHGIGSDFHAQENSGALQRNDLRVERSRTTRERLKLSQEALGTPRVCTLMVNAIRERDTDTTLPPCIRYPGVTCTLIAADAPRAGTVACVRSTRTRAAAVSHCLQTQLKKQGVLT